MIKKILIGLAGLLLLAIVTGTGLFVHVWYFKPFDINLFFGRTALQLALESPELLSSLRVLEPLGIDGHNAELDDDSMEAGDRFLAKLKEARSVLASYDDADLDEADRLSKDIMMSLFELIDEGEKFRFHNYPVNQLFGVQNGFPSFMESTHQVADVEDAEHYVARLSKVGIKFDQVLDGLHHREEVGVVPPQFVIDRVLEEMRNFVATPAEENILFTALETKMDEAGLAATHQERIGGEALGEIEATVYPAYQRLIDEFGLVIQEVGKRVGKQRSTVNNYLRLLKLPPEVQKALREKRLSMGHARALVPLGDASAQLALAEKVVREDLSVRAVEELVRRGRDPAKAPKRRTQPRKTPQVRALEDELRTLLGTKVSIRDRRGRGKIVIEYYSPEDFEGVLERLRRARGGFGRPDS